MIASTPSRRQLLWSFLAAALGCFWPAKAQTAPQPQRRELSSQRVRTTSYTYDLDGQRTDELFTDRHSWTECVFDAQNRLVSITQHRA